MHFERLVARLVSRKGRKEAKNANGHFHAKDAKRQRTQMVIFTQRTQRSKERKWSFSRKGRKEAKNANGHFHAKDAKKQRTQMVIFTQRTQRSKERKE